ncbi:hypothetical protein SOCE26_084270 [Sorangium cellulosum]|uniref:Secreted protein n=1 Tax=Sorangium cellulosum TaxID=56 RepID=A0A2L0F5W9_SORCE|nr:hypothetical protein [Sorangium cellulosum]AUX46917.1 hypothetical protein SOCE26_084270 [Sorangium cellulosum]
MNDRLAAPSALLLLLAAPAIGCADTSQPEVSYDAHAEAAPPGAIAAGAWTVALEEATVAFGPVYFCAASGGAATLCDVAIAEMLSVARVDLLDPAPQPLGRVHGFEGEIRSASFDYGVHWFLTEASPTPAPETPGGHSARLRGRATRGAEVLDFVAEVDALPQNPGQNAVPSIGLAARVGAEPVRLVVRFDVGAWIARVDFDALAADGAAEVAIAPGSRAHNVLVKAMTAQDLPELRWIDAAVAP